MKKGQIGGLPNLAVSLLVVILMVGLASLVLSSLLSIGTVSYMDTATNNSGFNSTITSGQSGLTTLSGFMPLIALAVVAMVVIGLFMGFGRR